MDVIDEDVKKIEEDVKLINCTPICEFIKDMMRCIYDVIFCLWKK